MIDPHNRPLQPAISLLEYLQRHGWKIVRDNGRDEVAGLCPLHRESRPSFYVNRRKQVFYCHGCGRGGGLARLIRWLEPAPESTAVITSCRDQKAVSMVWSPWRFVAPLWWKACWMWRPCGRPVFPKP